LRCYAGYSAQACSRPPKADVIAQAICAGCLSAEAACLPAGKVAAKSLRPQQAAMLRISGDIMSACEKRIKRRLPPFARRVFKRLSNVPLSQTVTGSNYG